MRPKNIAKEEAIRSIALQIIADEGLENLSMQKLAAAANVSPRTIYIKYLNKEDFLIKLFIDEVLGSYEKAILQNFNADMPFAEGVQLVWLNTYRYLTSNKTHFALIKYGKSSPLLNKAYQERDIKQGDHFIAIHQFLQQHIISNNIQHFPHDVYRAMLFAPLLDLVNEYFDYEQRPEQIITEEIVVACCAAVAKGLLK